MTPARGKRFANAIDGAALTLRVEPAGGEVVTSLSRGDEVLERVADLLSGAGEPTVAAEGIAFDLVGGAYVPALPPEVCPAP